MLKRRTTQEFGLLGLLLLVDALLAAVVARLLPFYAPNDEYFDDALVFSAHHRIYDAFLPVGYSGLLGLGAMWGGQAGVVVVSVALSLLLIASAWFYLRNLGLPIGNTFVIAALLSLYPDFLLSLHKAQDTEITGAIIFAFITFLLKSMGEDDFGLADVGLALTLAGAVLVRPNLLLFLFLSWFVYWRCGVPKAMYRSLMQLLIVAACYLAVTTAVHGKPFLPQNGPYNVYAGFNEDTQNYTNEEDSLAVVLPAHHIQPPHGASSFDAWNLRDPSLNPMYSHLALEFVGQHPGAAVELVGVKFWNLMRPDTDDHVHPVRSVGGAVKIFEGLAVPLWIMAMVLLPHPGPRPVKYILGLTAAVYLLPFLITVSSPRFRTPLDFLCWVDLGAIVATWRWTRSAHRAQNCWTTVRGGRIKQA